MVELIKSDAAETQLTRPPQLISGTCPLGVDDKAGNCWGLQTEQGGQTTGIGKVGRQTPDVGQTPNWTCSTWPPGFQNNFC